MSSDNEREYRNRSDVRQSNDAARISRDHDETFDCEPLDHRSAMPYPSSSMATSEEHRHHGAHSQEEYPSPLRSSYAPHISNTSYAGDSHGYRSAYSYEQYPRGPGLVAAAPHPGQATSSFPSPPRMSTQNVSEESDFIRHSYPPYLHGNADVNQFQPTPPISRPHLQASDSRFREETPGEDAQPLYYYPPPSFLVSSDGVSHRQSVSSTNARASTDHTMQQYANPSQSIHQEMLARGPPALTTPDDTPSTNHPGMPYPPFSIPSFGSHPHELLEHPPQSHGHPSIPKPNHHSHPNVPPHPYGPMYQQFPPHPYYYPHGPPPVAILPPPIELIDPSQIQSNDVLCGRGGATNSHSGNRAFRAIVKKHQERYLKAKKRDKPAVAAYVVDIIRNLSPPGRFLKKDIATGRFYDIGDEKALEKTAQALREDAPARRREMEAMRPHAGDDADAPGGNNSGGSPDSGHNTNAVSHGSSNSCNRDQSGSSGSSTFPGNAHNRKRSIVQIEDVAVPEDEGDLYNVPFEIPDADKIMARPQLGFRFGAFHPTVDFDIFDEQRDDISSLSDCQTVSPNLSNRENGDRDGAECIIGSREAPFSPFACDEVFATPKPAVCVVRPCPKLTKKHVHPFSIDVASPYTRDMYVHEFLPPRATMQRGPRSLQRKVIAVSANGPRKLF